MLIAGSYTWSYTKITYLGGSSFIETPSTTGITYRYVFKPSGKVDYFQNDSLLWSYNYVINYEFKVTTYPSDSATIVIINNMQTGQRQEFFRPYLCTDSAKFYNPYNTIDAQRYFKRD